MNILSHPPLVIVLGEGNEKEWWGEARVSSESISVE